MRTRIKLAGVQYSDYNKLDLNKVAKDLRQEKKIVALTLWHDKKNQYDDKAILVKLNSVKIGYIPKGEIKDLCWKAKRNGRKPSARLVGYHPTNPTWYMFTVELDIPIILEDDNDAFSGVVRGRSWGSFPDIEEYLY